MRVGALPSYAREEALCYEINLIREYLNDLTQFELTPQILLQNLQSKGNDYGSNDINILLHNKAQNATKFGSNLKLKLP